MSDAPIEMTPAEREAAITDLVENHGWLRADAEKSVAFAVGELEPDLAPDKPDKSDNAA